MTWYGSSTDFWSDIKDALTDKCSFNDVKACGFKKRPTKKFLQRKNTFGHSIAHYASAGGWLKHIPEELQTEDIFMQQNYEGEIPLHWCTDFRKVPNKLLSPKYLTHQNNNKVTPIHNLLLHQNVDVEELSLIPKDMLIGTPSKTIIPHLIGLHLTDHFLGTDMPKWCKTLTGQKWWDKNENFKNHIASAKTALPILDTTPDIDIF